MTKVNDIIDLLGDLKLTNNKEDLVKEEKDITSVTYWMNTDAFKNLEKKETQLKYYETNKASKEVLTIVSLDSKVFGSIAEKIIIEILGLGKRTSTQNDASYKNCKIEIKAARYWAGKDDCLWQHLEPDHDYDYAILCLLDFHGWKIWCIKKTILMGEMRDKKIVTNQGKQGWWTRKSSILPYLTPIKTRRDLHNMLIIMDESKQEQPKTEQQSSVIKVDQEEHSKSNLEPVEEKTTPQPSPEPALEPQPAPEKQKLVAASDEST